MRVIVVGGGLIGQAIAWRLASKAVDVVVVDKKSPYAASRVGAGLLIPAKGRLSRHHFALRRASADLYPSFVAELERQTGRSCGYNPCGSLTLAYQPKAEQALTGLIGCLKGFAIETSLLSARECFSREPALGPDVAGGFYTPDHQVDPVALLEALRQASLSQGVEQVEGFVVAVDHDRVKLGDGRVLRGRRVVVANGAWIGKIFPLPVYPVKGEVIVLKAAPDLIRHNLHLQRAGLYVANRGDGRYVVGATEEEVGFDTSISATAKLYEKVCHLVPALRQSELLDSKVGFRPKVGDGLPIMGDYEGIVVAGAHYQNGILQTPITAELLSDYIVSGVVSELMEDFLPTRDLCARHRAPV